MSLRKILLACSMLAFTCVSFTGCPKPGQEASKETKKNLAKPMVTSNKSAAAKTEAPKAAAPAAKAETKDAPKADAKPADAKK